MLNGKYKDILQTIQNITLEEVNNLKKDQTYFGTGSYGTVTHACLDGKDVAIKHFRKDHSFMNYRELTTIASCDHENIVKILAAGPDIMNNKLDYIIFEFADCLSLDCLLHGKNSLTVMYNLSNALSWMHQLARGADYLHRICNPIIIHRDIKPANLLIFNAGKKAKLCDFGTAKIFENRNTGETGTCVYMAPEVISADKDATVTYTSTCDVFSLAVTFWEVLTRKKPFCDYASTFSIVYATKSGKRLADIAGCPKILQQLITRAWHQVPDYRPSMEEITNFLDYALNRLFPPGAGQIALNIDSLVKSFDQIDAEELAAKTDALFSTQNVSIDEPDVINNEMRESYLVMLDPQLRPVSPLPNDDESQSVYHEHLITQEVYIQRCYKVDKLRQKLYDKISELAQNSSSQFGTALSEQQLKKRIYDYCLLHSERKQLLR